jgi:catechol 2,3-dioxygenase-like lactoylglutathione lyase family enzyme
MEFIGITRVVASVEKAKDFYEDVLGFTPGGYYEPTRWQSYDCKPGIFYAVGEAPGSTDEASFAVEDVETLWERVRNRPEIVHPLEHTPWGTYRFVIRDPDGHLLAFAQKQ